MPRDGHPTCPIGPRGPHASGRIEETPGDAPLDALLDTETLAEKWLDADPTADGSRQRVRIARVEGPHGMLRLEERVSNDRTRVAHAMAARHILVGPGHAAALAKAGLKAEISKSGAYLRVTVPSPEEPNAVPELVARLQALGMNDASPDRFVQAAGLSGDPEVGRGTSWHLENLGLFPHQKAGADINATGAWARRTDARPVIIALIDGGILHGEPELAEAIYAFPGETAGDGIDNDGNGYVDDVYGYDFAEGDAYPVPQTAHGTQCAALIAAHGGNGARSSGIAWQASILNCRVFANANTGGVSGIIDAIDYAIAAGARVMNLSWTIDGPLPLLEQALRRADQAGVIIVCPSGNLSDLRPYAVPPTRIALPAAMNLPLMVTVAASKPDDTLADFSLVDPDLVDLAAPGVNLKVSLAGDRTTRLDYSSPDSTGTSFASALVSGGLALAIAEHPDESPARILRRLLESVDPIPGGAAVLASGGRMNVGRMLDIELPEVAHDRFTDRRRLSDPAGRWTGGNGGAGTEAIDLNLGLKPAPGRTLWFEWTASHSGTLKISAKALSKTAAILRVFRESGGVPSSLAGQSLAAKPLSLAVARGERLFWMLDTSAPVATGLQISWQLPPPNDSLANAAVVTSVPATLSGSTLGATTDKFEGKKRWHTINYPGQSIWWKFVPDRSMEVVLSVKGSNCAAYLLPANQKAAIFPKDYHFRNNAGTPVAVEAGKTYAVLAVPSSAAAAGDVTLAITERYGWAFTSEPRDLAVLPGEVAGLQAGMLGRYDATWPSFQWYKDDQPLPLPTAQAGLNFTVTPESYGTYHLAMTGGGITRTTRKVRVTPRAEAPRLVEGTFEHRAIHGQQVALLPVFASEDGATFTWRKDGIPINGETGPSLYLDNVTTADSGIYSLTATNAHGSTRTDFPVEVLATPWKRWLRSDGPPAGRGEILQVALDGANATALTPQAWLSSTDHGTTWSELPLPANFTAVTGARLPDGTLLTRGSLPGEVYSIPTTYRKPPGGSWRKVTVSALLPDGTRETIDPLKLFDLDGKIHAFTHGRVLVTSDGLSWTPLTAPGQPGVLPRFTEAHRFGETLAFLYWAGSSQQHGLVLKPGGSHEIVAGDHRQIWQIDGTHEGTPYNPWGDFTELRTTADGILRGVTNGGGFLQGLTSGTLTHRGLGFTCYARSGSRWLLGYADGRLWSGEDLSEAPEKSTTSTATSLTAFTDEFISGDRQSSDGIRWQPLGPVTGQIVASTRDRFLLKHELPLLHHFDDDNVSMPFTSGVHPTAELGETSVHLFNDFWSGRDSALMTRTSYGNSNPGHIVRILRPGPSGTTGQDCELGIDWDRIDGATQIGDHWYVTGNGYSIFDGSFLVRSRDGVAWERMHLMKGYRVTGPDGFHIAAGVSHRGFRSPDGRSWTPHLMRGLPAAPDQVVSYRDHFLARVDKRLFASADGSNWHQASAGEPIARLAATRQGVVALTTGYRLLHPDLAPSTGPWLRLPPGYQALTVPRHQAAIFPLEAGDDDGDLVSVSCLIDGQHHATLTAPPFHFAMDTSASAARAVEFVARDREGRVSRTSALLRIVGTGVSSSVPLVIEPNPDRFEFKGRLYTRQHLLASDDGEFWHGVGPAGFENSRLVANEHALVAYNSNGIAVSHDGHAWTQLGGFKAINGVFSVEVHDGVFELRTDFERWISEDGLDWRAPTGTLHPSGVTWLDSLHGLSGSSVTRDGGRNWLRITSPFAHTDGLVVAAGDGYFVSGTEISNDVRSIQFLPKDGRSFTKLISATTWDMRMTLQSVGGLVLLGASSNSLYSTIDGRTLVEHTPPPCRYNPTYARLGGEWMALAIDGFYASPDLTNWRKIFDTSPLSGFLGGYVAPFNSVQAIPHGNGSLIVSGSEFGRRSVVITPDLIATIWPHSFGGGSPPGKILPGAYYGGKFFKDRVIAVDDGITTKPAGSGAGWVKAELLQGDGFESLRPHEWPDPFLYYDTSAVFAATDQRFVMLVKPYDRRSTPDVVIRSDDGLTFHVHPWNAPINLDTVKIAAASSDTFIAATSDGRVLKSTDGLNWSLHTMTVPTFVINTLHHFGGRWHAAGYHPHQWVGGTWTPAWSEIWSSADGETWQKSWENRSTLFTDTQGFETPVTAHGRSWIRHKRGGWLVSTDGIHWAVDPAAASPSSYGLVFQAIGPHPEGLLAIHPQTPGKLYILDPVNWRIRRSVETGGATIHPIDGRPFLKLPRNLFEWTEADPRLTSITASTPASSPGTPISIRLAAAELPEPVTIEWSLSADAFFGGTADIPIGSTPWSAGTVEPDGSRLFTAVIPSGLAAGSYRLTASFRDDSLADASLQNNLLVTSSTVFEAPVPPSSPTMAKSLTDPEANTASAIAELAAKSTVEMKAGHLVFTYLRPAGLPFHLQPVAEYSADLSSWQPRLPEGCTHRVNAVTGDTETVEITVPCSSGASGFLRLKLPLPRSTP